MADDDLKKYRDDSIERISTYKHNESLQEASRSFFEQIGIGKADYVYNFFWLGIPIIQIPQDVLALQEIIWGSKPDLIIETGIAWGGSLIFSASMLAILEGCGMIENAQVVGIDIDIREHTWQGLNNHPLKNKITMIQGSSIDDKIISQVKQIAAGKKRVMVCLDSNHTHDHVLAELRGYAPLVSIGCYCMVGDTIIEDAPDQMCSQRPWGKNNSPKTAVWKFLEENNNFTIDKTIDEKLLVTGSPDGYLKRTK